MPADRPIRLTVVLTHPVQYFSPWFRHIHAHEPELSLTVLYAMTPTPAQQGVGFGIPFQWDVPLLDGYASRVLREATAADSLENASGAIDAPNVGDAIAASSPDVVLVPGWHARMYRRALAECRRRRIPALYRGDSQLLVTHYGLAHRAWRWRTRRRLEWFDAFLAVGRRSREFLFDLGVWSNQVFDSPHAVDNERFARAAAPLQSAEARRRIRRQFDLEDHDFVALFAGKVEPKKRPLDAVAAAAKSGATLLVVGTGPLLEAVQHAAAESGARVISAGFLNQSRIADAYAAADCLVLPSDRRETWGLVVNEAMATGLPAIVSGECGCAPDLIDDTTGLTFPVGDVDAFASALMTLRGRIDAGVPYGPSCRERVSRFTFHDATAGIVRAARFVGQPTVARSPRVLFWAGRYVNPGGAERINFEIARTLVERGGQFHALVNRWHSDRIRNLAVRVGATWSSIYHHTALTRRTLNPVRVLRMSVDVAISSIELIRESRRMSATHLFLPDFTSVLSCSPALAWARLRGRPRVVLRLANAPDQTPFYRALWRFFINPLVTMFVCNSQHTMRQLLKTGCPADKARWIYNMAPTREPANGSAPESDLVYVGQIIPEKGLTELLEATSLIVREFPHVTLNIVGDVTGWVAPRYIGYRESVKARAAEPDLAGHVNFLGWREDVPAIMRASRLHCCPTSPTHGEPFGNVVAEAKVAGRPSIVTPSGALPELVAHRETGWIARDQTPAAFAEGIRYFLEDEPRWEAACLAAAASTALCSRENFEAGWVNVFAEGMETRGSEDTRR